MKGVGGFATYKGLNSLTITKSLIKGNDYEHGVRNRPPSKMIFTTALCQCCCSTPVLLLWCCCSAPVLLIKYAAFLLFSSFFLFVPFLFSLLLILATRANPTALSHKSQPNFSIHCSGLNLTQPSPMQLARVGWVNSDSTLAESGPEYVFLNLDYKTCSLLIKSTSTFTIHFQFIRSYG